MVVGVYNHYVTVIMIKLTKMLSNKFVTFFCIFMICNQSINLKCAPCTVGIVYSAKIPCTNRKREDFSVFNITFIRVIFIDIDIRLMYKSIHAHLGMK